MRILRLGTSDSILPLVDEGDRDVRIIEQAMAAEAGEPVETIAREIWPEPGLPGIIQRWLERFEPDMVSFKVSSYWFTYSSVPLRMRRLSRLGPVGPAIATAGLKAAARPSVGNSGPFELARRGLRRTLGGAMYFTPEETIQVMADCLRTLARYERAVVVVRGPLVAESWGCSRALRERAERDRQHVDRTLAALCRELRLHYTGRRVAPSYGEVRRYRGPDRLHLNAEGHRRQGTEEAAAHLAAWRAAHGARVPLYLESEAVC